MDRAISSPATFVSFIGLDQDPALLNQNGTERFSVNLKNTLKISGKPSYPRTFWFSFVGSYYYNLKFT